MFGAYEQPAEESAPANREVENRQKLSSASSTPSSKERPNQFNKIVVKILSSEDVASLETSHQTSTAKKIPRVPSGQSQAAKRKLVGHHHRSSPNNNPGDLGRDSAVKDTQSQGIHSCRGISEDRDQLKSPNNAPPSLPTSKFGAPPQGKLAPQSPQHLAMYTSMSDIGFTNKHMIITKDLRERMIVDSQNNWKVRTETIDMIAGQIAEKMVLDPMIVLNQAEQLMEFFVQMLGD